MAPPHVIDHPEAICSGSLNTCIGVDRLPHICILCCSHLPLTHTSGETMKYMDSTSAGTKGSPTGDAAAGPKAWWAREGDRDGAAGGDPPLRGVTAAEAEVEGAPLPSLAAPPEAEGRWEWETRVRRVPDVAAAVVTGTEGAQKWEQNIVIGCKS